MFLNKAYRNRVGSHKTTRMLSNFIKASSLAGCLLLLSACTPKSYNFGWRVRELALARAPAITLVSPSGKVIGTVSKLTMQKLLLANFRVTKAAGVQAELFIVDGTDPNAFAGSPDGRVTIAVNLAMLELLQEDVDEFASLFGHKAAHIAKGHGATGQTRSTTLQAIGSAVGMGLGAAGVRGGGLITGFAVDLIDTAYSRENEREADALGVQYAITAGYDPDGAVRLQEKLLKFSVAPLIPFLSSHPSGQERTNRLKALIAAKKLPPAIEAGKSTGVEKREEGQTAHLKQ
ncbi:MAG: M48 family metalloprotease [Candidatus Binatia bacterium]